MERMIFNLHQVEERRSHIRIPIIISVKEYSASGITLCLSRDISPGGMALRRAANGEAPEGEVILEFNLPGVDEKLQIKSEFLRSTPNQKIQSGVVKFRQLPQKLQKWFERTGELYHRQTYIT